METFFSNRLVSVIDTLLNHRYSTMGHYTGEVKSIDCKEDPNNQNIFFLVL